MSTYTIKILMVFYVVLTIASIREKNWPMFRYWVGAIILSWGVLGMK